MKRIVYAALTCMLMLAPGANAQSGVRMFVDAPVSNATVPASFLVAGWAFDTATSDSSGIDAVHVWAFPGVGGDPVFLGAASIGGNRQDVLDAYGRQSTGFGLNVGPILPAGAYVLHVFAHQASNSFQLWSVIQVPVTISNVTLGDLDCLAQQVPLWDGTAWICATGAAGPQGPAGATGTTGATGAVGSAGPAGAAGAAGAVGLTGAVGPAGAAGAAGLAGPAGAVGAVGAVGAAGATGPTGPSGAAGATGAAGPTGSSGAAGATGTAGLTGSTGAAGATGAAGPAGAAGAAGGLAQYGYFYNTTAQTVAIEADVLFSTNGVRSSGITHTANAAQIVVSAAGTYDIAFTVSAVEPNQFTIFVNGTEVVGTTFGSGAGTQQNHGQVILLLAAGDVVTLRNHSSSAAVTLQTLAGGTQTNVNASIIIRMLRPQDIS